MNNRIYDIRKHFKLTLEEFGKRLGVTKSAISNIEKGRRSVTDQIVISICREFNVNEEWLRTGKGNMFLEIDKELQLMRWAGDVFKQDDESFKKRFVKMLSELNESDWEALEKMTLLLHDKKD